MTCLAAVPYDKERQNDPRRQHGRGAAFVMSRVRLGPMKEKKSSPVPKSTNELTSSADQLERFLELALHALLEIMGTDTGWLQLLAPGGDRSLASACQGCTAEMKLEADSLALREAVRPAVEARAVIVPDLARATDPALASFLAAGFASLVVVPLRTNLFHGFLGVLSRRPTLNGESAENLELKASLISAALEKGALSRGLTDLLAAQAQPKRGKDRKRIAAIAGKVRHVVGKADKKFTLGTTNLLQEPGWEDLLEKYGAAPAAVDKAGPGTGSAREKPAPPEAPRTAEEAPAGQAAPDAAAAPDDAFEAHAGRMESFRKSHTNLR
jgi:hypothetical protein